MLLEKITAENVIARQEGDFPVMILKVDYTDVAPNQIASISLL
jgi:DNA-directed RNA polymerase subunit beta